MGLGLNVRDAVKGLRNSRFVLHSLIWCFLLGPAVAFGITYLFPLDPAEQLGQILLGVSPCAPFLPLLLSRAKSDPGHIAAFMLMAAIGTVIIMPLEVPLLDPALSVNSWTIAKPLIGITLMPLALGMTLYYYRPNWASRVQPVMKKVNWVFAAATVGLSWLVYGEGLLRISLPAGFALVIYFIIMTLGSYAGGIGLVPHQRLVLAVGSGTRNLGVAIAPLVSLPVIDERTIGMIVLAAPVMVLTSLGSSRIFQLRMAGSPPSLR